MHVSETCANCAEVTKCKRRDFSEQAWSVLLVWDEIEPSAVDQPICQDCYTELRDVLIDRADEIEAALADAPAEGKSSKRVRKAG